MSIPADWQEEPGVLTPGGTTVVTERRAWKWAAYHYNLAAYYCKMADAFTIPSRVQEVEALEEKHSKRAEAWEKAIADFKRGRP